MIAREDILALLEEQPYLDTALAALLEQPIGPVRELLMTMQRDGQVRRRPDRGGMWSMEVIPDDAARDRELLAFLTPGPKAMAAIRSHMKNHATPLLRRLRRLVYLQKVKRLGAGPKTTWALAGYEPGSPVPVSRPDVARRHEEQFLDRPAQPLRQPPPSTTVAKDAGPSWWVGLSRTQLAEATRNRQAVLKESRAHLSLSLRILQ